MSQAHTQTCRLCLKDYQTSRRQQRYCKNPCQPLTAKEIRQGITDAVRRGEAEPIPNPSYGESKKRQPRKARSTVTSEVNQLSREWLSIRL